MSFNINTKPINLIRQKSSPIDMQQLWILPRLHVTQNTIMMRRCSQCIIPIRQLSSTIRLSNPNIRRSTGRRSLRCCVSIRKPTTITPRLTLHPWNKSSGRCTKFSTCWRKFKIWLSLRIIYHSYTISRMNILLFVKPIIHCVFTNLPWRDIIRSSTIKMTRCIISLTLICHTNRSTNQSNLIIIVTNICRILTI